MKRIFTLLVLTLFFGLSGLTQRSYINYSKDSRWFVGINGGATWHSRTETSNLIGGGYGFTFGRSFGMKPEKLFSWDLRLRYLHGWWAGQNTSPTTLDSSNLGNVPTVYPATTMQAYANSGTFIPNFRTQLISGSVELALNTNRLRENTGWNFQIFGGIGIKGYDAKTDLVDGSGQIYDYSGVNNSKTAILDYRDGVYETGDGFDIDWAGSFGAGISYQLTPWMSVGLSHKMTWTRDNTKFDLMPNDAGGINTGNNDIYHYSSAGLKFHLFGGGSGHVDHIVEDTTNINNFDLVNENPTPVVVQKPIVDIYDPGVSPYTVEYDHFNLRAYVHHVAGRQNISFKQNGITSNNFNYDPSSDQFSSNVNLQPGQNIFEITGWNDGGQDYESTIIVYKPEEPVIQPPIVTITNPSYSPFTTPNSVFSFASTVLNVDSKSQIKVYFNGQYLPNFTYDLGSKQLYATLNLNEGSNTVTVTATNNAGSDSKTCTIIYEKPVVRQPPIVDFINPAANPYISATNYMNITASVLNVDGKANINVRVNGNPVTNFTYSVSTKYVNFNVTLQEGANVIEVTGTNEVGSDYDNTTIIYKRPETPVPPVVTFIDPAINPITIYSPSYNITAKVLNVNSASDITLKINGIQSYNFAYSSSSHEMTFGTNLLQGSNVIEITGTNQYGSDQKSTTIIYKKIVPQAPPVVTITYPASDNEVFSTPSLTLSANVLNVAGAANITVSVNGNMTSAFNYNTATKVLYLPLTLLEGTNTVVITGTNTSGSHSDTRLIIYKKPQVPAPPTVAFVNPPTSPYVVTTQGYTITANTTNIDTKSQISLLHNGNLIPDAQYTFTSSHQIIYNCQLIQGSNIFEIIVTNNDGSANAMAIVTYKKEDVPCIIPTVGYISPVPYSTVDNPNVNVDAQINNHSPETVIELLLNGVSKGFMTWNGNTSVASLPVILAEGSNAITVIVTNNCGSNQATFTINYKKPEAPCVDPTLSANQPVNQTTQSATITLSAGVSDVAGQSNINVTLNGQSVPFTFDAGTMTISITNATLSLGNNTVIITANNSCGTATLTYFILRESCDKPVFSNASHNSGFISNDASIAFTVQISNAAAAGIELLINNIAQPFTYNEQTGILSASINLTEGNNSVAVHASNACGTTDETYTFVYKLPCVNIGYNLLNPASLNTAVTDPNYSILLHVTGTFAVDGLSATLNGTTVPATYDQVAGNVSVSGLTLTEGSNTIEITLKNDCSREVVKYNITYNGCKPPSIDFPSVNNGSVVNSSTLELAAVIQNSNGAGNILLTLNGVTQSFDFNDQTNLLTSTLTLNEGQNTILITVNGCETKSGTLNITYEIPCSAITANLMQPATNTETVVDASYNISLAVQNVDNQQQISVTHNGNNKPFAFDGGSGIITISGLTLIDGANNIVVTANNACSNKTITYNIQYNGCKPPVITLGSNSTAVSMALYSFTATVTNISNQNNIQVLVNGAPASFVFQNGTISAEVTLVEGANTITINANGCETASKTFNVVYTIPCDPIVFSLASPTQTETSVADDMYTITLVAQNANSNAIAVKLNGATVPFTYVNDLITISNLQLIDGDNTVVVVMSNNCSSETVTYTIHHDGCDAPVISIAGNADAVNSAAYNFAATVSNVSNQNELSLKLNGNPVNFNYNSGTGTVSASLQLNEGTNSIVLAANTCASATENLNVTYTVPCLPVTYTLGSPANLTSVVTSATTNITLNTQHVTNQQAVSVTVNGNPANFTFSNNVISISNISLNNGANVVVVSFSNNCSNETVTYQIESDQCQGPVITVSNSNMVTEDPLYTFTCNVQNVSGGNNVSVKINGQTVNCSYSNGVVTAQMSLQEGANEVVVTATGCETTSATYTVVYQIPCVPPVITFTSAISSTSSSYSFSASVSSVQAQGDISVKLNGQNVPFTFNNGNISASLTLVEGSNIVTVVANGCQSVSATHNINFQLPCNPPVITISSGNATESNPYSLNAAVTNVQGQNNITVKLNGQSVPFTYTNGTVTASLTLNTGANNISIEAAGCENKAASTTVTYNEPSGPCGPRFNPGNSQWEFCLITSGATYTRDDLANNSNFSYSGPASAVYFKPIAGGGDVILNGQPYSVQNGQYYLFQGNLTVDVSSSHPGSMGHWEICLTADNIPQFGNGNNRPTSPCESAPCDPPVVTITSAPSSTSATYTLAATATNVQGQNNITVKLNGQSVPFTYTNGTVTASLTLNAGANNISVEAAGCENKSATIAVTYQAPCAPPVITITSGTSATTVAYTFTATVSNVLGQSNITVKQNGQSVPFSYNNSTVSANLTLVNGANNIVVEAVGCETKSASAVVNYQAPCVPPVITVTSPTASESNPYSLSATVTNVQGQGNITVKLNNQSVPFTYSNGTVTANLTLIAGANAIKIEATGCETKTVTTTVTYTEPTGNTDFEIGNDGTVNVGENVCATIKCLGESVVYNNSQEAYVSLEYSINGGSNWWTFNGGNNVSGGENVTMQVPSGSGIVIKATCVNAQGNWTNTLSSNSGSQYVYVLKNGDTAPNFAPAQGQAAVETFLAGLVDNQGHVTIGPNDVIYLFELRHVGNIGVDYQDCVMLVTLNQGSNCPPAGDPVRSATHPVGESWLPPAFQNINPANTNMVTDKEMFGLKTKITNINDPADVKVYLNGALQTGSQYNMGTKEVTGNLKLNNGSNTIKIDAVNGNQSKSVTYTVSYQDQQLNVIIAKPSITNIDPATTTATATRQAFTFKAKVENVNSKNDIQVSLNGASFGNFTYNTTSKELLAVMQLQGGVNTINVVAINGNERVERTYTITYREPVIPEPVITNISPAGTTERASVATYTFRAKVLNVSSKNDIKLYVNNTDFGTFTYSSSTQEVMAILKLNPGANTVKLVAQNASNKRAERTYTIELATATNNTQGDNNLNGNVDNTNTTIEKPVIVITEPSQSGSTVTNASYTFKAKVEHVTGKENIELKINGVLFTGFNYNAATGQVTAVLKLKDGNNVIYIKARNGREYAEKTVEINFKTATNGTDGNGGRTINTGGGSTNTGGGTTNTGGGGRTTNTGGGTNNTGGGTTNNGGGRTTNTGGGTTNTGGGTTNTGTGGGRTTNTGGGRTNGGG